MTTRHPTANASQRARRALIARIDYFPSREALAAIESRRTRSYPTNINSGIIDTIIAEWAVFAGLKQTEIDKPKTSAKLPELSDQYARARITSDNDAKCAHARTGVTSAAPEFQHASRACVRANNFGTTAAKTTGQKRVICGAMRRRDGQPCQALSVPSKRRCKWHGGCSTGPRTDEGRARSILNLRQYQSHSPCESLTADS